MPSIGRGREIPLSGSSNAIKVIEYIAEGGQGEVYRVSMDGREYALKWYSKQPVSDGFYKNLAHNVHLGAPTDHFLWPLAITERDGRGRFGYVMRLRPNHYREYGEFLLGEARFASWKTMFSAALNIVEGYRALHSMGYSYQDLNEGSFFIDPNSGDVLICDNDNVAPYGINLGVKGMPKYMAPEVVTDEAKPSVHTDRFSLAVILFRLFYIDHPLEGSRTIKLPLTDQIGATIFGSRPLFVCDPNDKGNRPDPDAHPNVIARWGMFPPDLTAAFARSFTHGLKDIDMRLTEQQWIEALVRARGMLVEIDGAERFVNAYSPRSLPKECLILMTKEAVIPVVPGSLLYRCQTDRRSNDWNARSATVSMRSLGSGENVYCLRNLTDDTWHLLHGKNSTAIAPNDLAPLLHGDDIDFGTVTARVLKGG